MTLITATIAARTLATDERGLLNLCAEGIITPRNMSTGEPENIPLALLSPAHRKRLSALPGSRRGPLQGIGFDLAEIEAVRALSARGLKVSPRELVAAEGHGRLDALAIMTQEPPETETPPELSVQGQVTQGEASTTPELLLQNLRDAGECDPKVLARKLKEQFPQLAFAKIGGLLPADPNRVVDWRGRDSRGKRLLGLKK